MVARFSPTPSRWSLVRRCEAGRVAWRGPGGHAGGLGTSHRCNRRAVSPLLDRHRLARATKRVSPAAHWYGAKSVWSPDAAHRHVSCSWADRFRVHRAVPAGAVNRVMDGSSSTVRGLRTRLPHCRRRSE